MTEKEIKFATPKETLPFWNQVKCGDFVKVSGCRDACLAFVHPSNLITVVSIDSNRFWSNREIFDLPKLEKIYSKVKITLYD